MVLLVFGMVFTSIRMYKLNPAFTLAIFPALCLCLVSLLIIFTKKILDLRTKGVLDKYQSFLETHKRDKEWLNKEMLNEQHLSCNKVDGNIHQRKKVLIQYYIQQFDAVIEDEEKADKNVLVQTEVAIQTTKEDMAKKLVQIQMEHEAKMKNLEERLSLEAMPSQQYIDAINSNNSNKLSANAKKINEAFRYIYTYIDDTLTCKFHIYELEYFKVHVFEHITNIKVDKKIEKPISSINGIQKSDLGGFLHNLFVMCKYYNPPLKKSDFFENCQKYFNKSICDTAILSTNSTRIANGQKIFPIDMKKDNFFKDYLKEKQ